LMRTPGLALVLMLAAAAAEADATVTFSRDVAPVIYRHCTPCHHDGGIGPFPLASFAEVRKHAAEIVAVTRSRYMPPWPPEDGYGEFEGERRLTAAELRILSDWVKGGAPEGDRAAEPAPPRYTSEWQMGKPDLVLRMAKPFRLPADGSDVFRNFIIPTGLKETRYVRGIELRLDNTRVVHHANIVLDHTQSLRKRDGEDGQPGFPGMDVITEAAPGEFDPDSHFLFWKPGSVLKPEPDDMSWKLDPDTDLVLNLHLQPTGKPESVQAEIGLYFASHPPSRFPILVQLEDDGAIDIAPGDRTFSVTDHLKLPVGASVLAIYPHAHYLGKVVEAWAILPDGTRRWLIRIPDWDINWQAVYNYKQPVHLPKGTMVAMRITYDNSTSNPRNPNHPPKRVRTGDRAEDEMGHIWLQLLPDVTAGEHIDPRFAIEEAVMRRRLEKYPADFVAHYNLGALLQYRGDLAGAISCYREALRVEPANPSAHNSLGAALLMQNRIGDAIPEFRETLRIDPSYSSARYNLARALAATGDLDTAAAEYATFLRQKPDDAQAQAGLGTIEFRQHRYAEALEHFRQAARLDPGDTDIQTNFGTLLAIHGDLNGAVGAFEQALRIDPQNRAARDNLERARAQLAAQQ
jgi:Flp pilus assembly protein TadD